jgi:uncharacterized protein YjbI with pentapeptide repeats
MRIALKFMKEQARTIGGVATGVVIGLASAAIVSASIPDANGVIHGCIRNNGDLRIIDTATQSCTSAQDPISFNQTGPQGPAGTSGSGFVGDLTNANLEEISWIHLDLRNLDFHGSTFSGQLKGSSLVGANLSDTTFNGIVMDNADVHGVNLSGSAFGTSFFARNTNFSGANFTNATITAADGAFTPIKLTNANFQNANFTGTQFVPFDPFRRIDGGDFSNAQFINATFSGATWDNTVCPDGTNSDNNGNTCIGHFTL